MTLLSRHPQSVCLFVMSDFESVGTVYIHDASGPVDSEHRAEGGRQFGLRLSNVFSQRRHEAERVLVANVYLRTTQIHGPRIHSDNQ